MCLAVPGEIISVSGLNELRTGRVSFGGLVKEINLAFVPDAQVGDYVVAHAGIAISIIDQAEAQQTLHAISEMIDLERSMQLRSDSDQQTTERDES